jgi:hypothetical protein
MTPKHEAGTGWVGTGLSKCLKHLDISHKLCKCSVTKESKNELKNEAGTGWVKPGLL